MVLSESLQAMVEAMHMSKAQANQAPRKIRRGAMDTSISPWYKVLASLAPALFQRESEVKQYPILPYEVARDMYSVLLAMHSRFSAV
jgi:hypothetical protein